MNEEEDYSDECLYLLLVLFSAKWKSYPLLSSSILILISYFHICSWLYLSTMILMLLIRRIRVRISFAVCGVCSCLSTPSPSFPNCSSRHKNKLTRLSRPFFLFDFLSFYPSSLLSFLNNSTHTRTHNIYSRTARVATISLSMASQSLELKKRNHCDCCCGCTHRLYFCRCLGDRWNQWIVGCRWYTIIGSAIRGAIGVFWLCGCNNMEMPMKKISLGKLIIPPFVQRIECSTLFYHWRYSTHPTLLTFSRNLSTYFNIPNGSYFNLYYSKIKLYNTFCLRLVKWRIGPKRVVGFVGIE